MKYRIRSGRRTDAVACFELIKELALYEKAPEAVSNTLQQFTEDGFGENPLYHLLVAETEGAQENKVIGMALFVTSYSTWKGKKVGRSKFENGIC